MKNQTQIDKALTTKEAAEICGLSHRTLEHYRLHGGGPEYFRVGGGRIVRYRLSDLYAWMDKFKASSTTEESAK